MPIPTQINKLHILHNIVYILNLIPQLGLGTSQHVFYFFFFYNFQKTYVTSCLEGFLLYFGENCRNSFYHLAFFFSFFRPNCIKFVIIKIFLLKSTKTHFE